MEDVGGLSSHVAFAFTGYIDKCFLFPAGLNAETGSNSSDIVLPAFQLACPAAAVAGW
jgi:hypothetical protein